MSPVHERAARAGEPGDAGRHRRATRRSRTWPTAPAWPTSKSLVGMLIQTDRFGTSVADALRVHADTMRTKRRQRAEEAAAKTTIKLVFPLVLFVFPAMFVVVLGPSVIADLPDAQAASAVRLRPGRQRGAGRGAGRPDRRSRTAGWLRLRGLLRPRRAWRRAKGCCSSPAARSTCWACGSRSTWRSSTRGAGWSRRTRGSRPAPGTRLAPRRPLRAGAAGRHAGRPETGTDGRRRWLEYQRGGRRDERDARMSRQRAGTADAPRRLRRPARDAGGHRPVRRVRRRPAAQDALRPGRPHRPAADRDRRACRSPSWTTSCSRCSSAASSRCAAPAGPAAAATSSTWPATAATAPARRSTSSQYVGPGAGAAGPVPRAGWSSQSIRHAHVTQEVMRDGFQRMVLADAILDMLGPGHQLGQVAVPLRAPGQRQDR